MSAGFFYSTGGNDDAMQSVENPGMKVVELIVDGCEREDETSAAPAVSADFDLAEVSSSARSDNSAIELERQLGIAMALPTNLKALGYSEPTNSESIPFCP